MRLLTNRNISYFFILLTLITIAVLAYFTFNVYKEYQAIEKKIERQVIFNKLNGLLKEIEREQFFSAVYLSKKSSYTLKTLKNQQKRTNYLLEKNLDLLNSTELHNLPNRLFKVRQQIETTTPKYLKVLSQAYQGRIIQPIILYMSRIANSNCKINELMLIRLRDSLNLENSFLAFLLLDPKKMHSEDLLFWESILEKRVLPNFVTSNERKIFIKLNAILDLETFPQIGLEQRVQLFLESKKGEYSISLNEWLKIVNEKVKKIDEAENILVYNDKITLDNELLRKERELNKYIFIFLLIIILLALLLSMVHILTQINRDRHFLKNTLREIEIDLDEDKKRELEALIHRNDSIEIYKFLANAIKEPSRAKDLFLANMSHEIRTPLNGIVGFTKELQTTKLNSEQREMLEIIEESSHHLIHIVNDILDFSKLKAGKVELESIAFNPITKFEAAIDTFVAKAREKHIELKVYIDPNIPLELLGDPTKILQVLNNLISNAIKFTVDEGSVDISIVQLVETDSKVRIKFVVKDSGIGVDEEEKQKIFDEFSQADVSTSRKYGGTGLGLSISSQFVKHMGGELEIVSSLGKGSSFFFSLDLDKVDTSIKRERGELNQFRVGYIPPKESRAVDRYLKSYIEYQGAGFFLYERSELLNLNIEELPHLLFIDYRCFDKKGELKAFLDLPIKVVLIVADNKENELGYLKEKIDYILHKPVNFTRTAKALKILKQIKDRDKSKQKSSEVKFLGKKALIAEDNFINQKLMKSILNRFGMEVEVVANGKEALEYRKRGECDIIFMDVQMPIMSGTEATNEILHFERENNLKHIPIVALTANALEGDKEKYLNKGMDAYLAKPMKLEELEKILIDFI